MTDPEKLSIRGQLLAQAEQSENDLALHREKALQIAASLKTAANVISNFALADPSGEDCLAGPPPTQQIPQHPFQSVLDYSQVVAVLVELRAVRQDVYNLRQRKALIYPTNR